MHAEPLLNHRDDHGEGIVWLASSNRIAWVDILGKRVMTARPDGSNICVHEQPSETCAVLPARDGRLVLVRRNEAVFFDETNGETELIWSAGNLEPVTNRFNDAAIDPFGNLWIGSMDFDATAPSGILWRVSPDGTASKRAEGYACLNGPVFSNDGRTLYLGDTMAGQVLAFDHDPETGALFNKRIFVDLKPFGGLCDGMSVCSEGNLWVCQITAGRISSYAPDGTKLATVPIPMPMVTSCCFGGPDLSTLYVITSRIILDDVELDAYAESGSIYTIKTNARGTASPLFGTISED